jgi:hypothetical protein
LVYVLIMKLMSLSGSKDGDERNKTGNVRVNVIEARSCNLCCSGRSISIVYFECVFVALVIQHAMRMRPVTLSSVACPAVQYFSTFSTLFHKWHDFRKCFIERKMYVLIFATNFVRNVSHCTTN